MKGKIWNESKVYKDPITLRNIRQITTSGVVNTVSTYHTAKSFSESGEEMIFITIREGKTLLCKVNLLSGDITSLIDPLDGLGGLEEIEIFGDGRGIAIGAVLAPKTRWVYYLVGRQIRAVHMDTFQEKIVVDGVSEECYIESIAVSPNEQNLAYIVNRRLPKYSHDREYQIYIKPADHEARVLLTEDTIAAGHLAFNPVDSDLLLFNRDRGPSVWDRIDEHSRTWMYRISERKMIEVKTLEKQNIQTHTAWTWDGRGIVYHGMMQGIDYKYNRTESGWYIGMAGLDGNPIREYSFPEAKYYGHVSAMQGRNAAIIDGNLMEGMLMWLYFDDEIPRLEMIARHDSNFMVMPSQYSHPHAISDPSGRWIVYNSSPSIIFKGPRSNIFAVEV